MSELDQYDYTLPTELIAQEPLKTRSDSRLMVLDREFETISHSHVRDLRDWIDPNDCLVFNNTKVIPAQLTGFRKNTRGRWQGLFLEADQQGVWKVLCKTRGRLKPGDVICLQNRDGVEDLQVTMLAKLTGGAWAIKPNSTDHWSRLLELNGRVPLPHYIRNGNMTDADLNDYQTVFAQTPGAVAAPTAGLHFTKELLGDLKQHGVSFASITLHVGIGTFRPVKAEKLEDHDMHFERGEIDEENVAKIQKARANGGRIIAVGTTSVRVLETAAASGTLKSWSGETDLFIRPPYQFKAVDAMLTNFHLPRSTLLVLVRTFGGDQLLTNAYDNAIAEKYRFYSYGDAMLIS